MTQFELLFSHLAHYYYHRFPEALAKSEHKLRFEDISAFSTIDDLKFHYVSKRVEGMLRGSVEDWDDFLKKHGATAFSKVSSDWPRLIEVFQRRNLLVHSNGHVNRVYLSKVSPALAKEYFGDEALHRTVEADESYLKWAIDEIEATGAAVALSCLLRWNKNSIEAVIKHAIEVGFWATKRGNWKTARLISGTLREQCSRDSDRWALSINYWVACKREGFWEEVRHEVETADVSAIGDDFRLARLAILGKAEEFFDELQAGEYRAVYVDVLENWPFTEELRTHPRYQQALERTRAQELRQFEADLVGRKRDHSEFP